MNQKTQVQSREILTGCRAIIIGFCETQSSAFASTVGDYLFDKAERAKADKEQREYMEARQLIDLRGDQLQKQFEKRIKAQFKDCFPARGQNPSQTDSATLSSIDEDTLGLVDEAEVEISVAIDSMSHRIESDCSDELYGLAQRMAVLNRGVKLDPDNIPYSAKLFCRAFYDFINAGDPEQTVKLLLLKLFERHFLKKIPELYKEINQYLITANVLPNLRYKSKSMAQPRRRKTDQLIAESEERQAELYKSIESILSGGTSPINPQLPAMTVEQAIHELNALQLQQQTNLQGNLFSHASPQQLPDTNTLSLQQALECVSTLFNIVHADESMADPVKTLLSHLHTPYARVALADPTFLQNPQHDARKLFNAMVGASEQWTDSNADASGELVQRIKTVVERIVQNVGSDKKDDLTLFGELLAEFSSFVEAFERKIKLTEQRSIQAVEGREKLVENQLKVEQIIEEKVGEGSLPKPVLELITEVWSSFLTYTLLRHGEQSKEWRDALRIVDTILWYMEPKTTDREIKLADDIRDSLHQSLELGMQSVGIAASDIKSRLHSLDLCRKLATENASVSSEETNASENHNTTNSNSASQSRPQATTDSQPEQTTADKAGTDDKQQIKSATQNTSSPPTKTRIQMQLESARQQASELEGSVSERVALQDDIDKVLSLKFGTWLAWKKPNQKLQQLKLTWYNAKTQNCMLSDHRGKEVAIVTANTIAVGLSDGSISIAEQQFKQPLFERMLEAVTGRLQNTQTGKYSARH